MSESCFICHSSLDAAEAKRLADALEAKGCGCWIAPRDIPAGSVYTTQIMEGIRKCQSFLVLLTNQAATSPHILRELETAVSQGKKIIPLRLPGVELGDSIAYLLSSLQWIEVTAGDLWNVPDQVADRVLAGEGIRLQKKPARKPRRAPLLLGLLLLLAIALPIAAWGFFANGPRPADTKPAPSFANSGTPAKKPGPAPAPDPPSEPAPTIGKIDAPVLVKPLSEPTPGPEPAPVAAPVIPSAWTCKVKSEYVIEWAMTIYQKDGRWFATGTKSVINGEKAGRKEKATTLTLDGALDGNRWTGKTGEDAQVGKIKTAAFDVTFSPDFRSFGGTLSANNTSADFSGKAR